jgi:hypothetical protein
LHENKDRLGVALLVSPLSSSSKGTLTAMNESGIYAHCIGCSNYAETLSSTEDWPNYQRIQSSDGFKMPILAELFLMNKWRSFCLIINDNEASKVLGEAMIK